MTRPGAHRVVIVVAVLAWLTAAPALAPNDRPDAEPTGWDTRWYGPGRGGWARMPTGQ